MDRSSVSGYGPEAAGRSMAPPAAGMDDRCRPKVACRDRPLSGRVMAYAPMWPTATCESAQPRKGPAQIPRFLRRLLGCTLSAPGRESLDRFVYCLALTAFAETDSACPDTPDNWPAG